MPARCVKLAVQDVALTAIRLTASAIHFGITP